MLCGFVLGLTDGLFFQKDHFAPQMVGKRYPLKALAAIDSLQLADS